MNATVNKHSLSGDKFMSEMHLRQLRFTYSAQGPFSKNKERMKKFKETGDSGCIDENEQHKACFQHDMAYGDFEDLNRRTAAHKVLREKAFTIAEDPKYGEYQCELASMLYKSFDESTAGSGIKNENILNTQ